MASPTILAINVAITVAIVLALILALDIHPIVSLVVGALYMGIASGMGMVTTVENIGTGFGNLMAAIGLPIIFGIIIGLFLARSGGARQIALTLVNAVGEKKVPYAIGLSGVIVSIPVFFDVAFLVLVPMAIAVWRETDVDFAKIVGPLAFGALGAHTLIPPTPNPLAAPDLVGFPLSDMMLVGIFVGLPLIMIGIWIYLQIIDSIWDDENDIDEIPIPEEEEIPSMPSFTVSLIPVLIPIVLILLRSVSDYANVDNVFLNFFSTRIMALGLGAVVAIAIYWNEQGPEEVTEVFDETMDPIGLVLGITGAGGALGFVIQETGAGEALVDLVTVGEAGIAVIFLGYALGAIMRIAQGSGTVAGITAMGIMGGVELAVPGVSVALACLSGGVSIGHVNDSGFWIVTTLSGLQVTGGFKTYTLGGFIISIMGLISALGIAIVF